MKKILLISVFLLCSCTLMEKDTLIKDTDKLSLSLQVGALDKALSIATANVQKDPENIDAKFALADIYYQQGKYDLQFMTLSGIVIDEQQDPNKFIKLNMNLMKNSLKRNEYTESISYYEKISKSKNLTTQQRGKMMEYSGVAYCKIKKFDLCLSQMNEAIKLLPGDTSVIDNLNIATYMKNSEYGKTDLASLYRGYHDSNSGAMLANLVMALVKDKQEGQAYKLLNQHFSSNDSMKIIRDLRVISNESEK